MKTYRMADYASEGTLVVEEDAAFFARRFGKDDRLDFTGITQVSAKFLDVLLAGHSPESLDGRILGSSQAVERAFLAWLDRQTGSSVAPPAAAMPPSPPGPPVPPEPRTPPIEYLRPEPEGERYTPTRLVRRLREQLQRYIESAYPLSDPVLVRSRRCLLEEARGGRLLAQEPYVETTPRYRAFSGSYADLGLPTATADLFAHLATTSQQYALPDDRKTVLFPSLYQHQADAYRTFLVDGKDMIVATGTGSGKTECFLVPALGHLFAEATSRPASFARRAMRVLILYPMNALVNDQLSRLRLLFGDPAVTRAFASGEEARRHPTFGMYTGRTPYPGPRDTDRDRERVAPFLEHYLGMEELLRRQLRRLGRYPAKNIEDFFAADLAQETTYATGKRKGQRRARNNFHLRFRTQPGDSELLTRQEMVRDSRTSVGDAPDILVTNYTMLEYMLMRPFERPIFRQTEEWLRADEHNQFLLVLDEAHMYRGAKGAEVGFLLRRLRARLGINDRPDKLRVICTSASLGSGATALDNIRRFAADLTGKEPDDFTPITGCRDVPQPAAPGTDDLADLLAAIDLDQVHTISSVQTVRTTLTPLLEYLGHPCPDCDENGLWSHVHSALRGQPVVNLLLQQTAGQAQSLETLAGNLFPGHPRARKATEVLVTLGAIARDRPDNPGLVPTRVHAFFRGLHGLYACINPRCSGRQDHPGETASLGKLFSEARPTCDSCGARVFEIASCRSCGGPYLLAYCPTDKLGSLEFLWGETEGNLEVLQLLPQPPRYGEQVEEIRVHLQTGFLDRELRLSPEEVRPLWLYRDDQNREAKFKRCAMCQPGGQARARINDFRTRGEQPFTALIDAQFAEQPPQSPDTRLPNRGRKVLVFSDGRQKAARLAPALEHSHARDLFRQVLGIASRELETRPALMGMHLLYPAVLWVCHERGINLFPAPNETLFADHLQRTRGLPLETLIQDFNQGLLAPTQSYARQLFDEMTDRYYSLNALGLATIEENPYLRGVFRDFPEVGMSQEQILVLMRSWLRLQLEERRFLPPGADISNLGEGWERPQGMDPAKPGQIVSPSFQEYLRCILGEQGATAVQRWFLEVFIRRSDMFRQQNDVYFLEPTKLSLHLRLTDHWFRCRDCGRLYHETLRELCPACAGNVVAADADYLDARVGFYRQQMQRALGGKSLEPFSLIAAEHSAQLTGKDDADAFSKTETYELRFQDILLEKQPPIDVLSCTTTMEVGIDIGQLCGVALRNVPPHVANYQQRAGRAGRRGRAVASVITYAHGTSHDAQYYEAPDQIISGSVRPPIVYIENQQVLRRHVSAYLIQRFFHERVEANRQQFDLFSSLGTVEQFLEGNSACSLDALRTWLGENENALIEEVRRWAPRHSHGLNEGIPQVDQTIATAVPELLKELEAVLPVALLGQREQLEGPVREGLEQQLAEQLLETLIGHATLPRYAFPTSVVSFWVSRRKIKGDPPHRRFFDYEPQRDLQLALTEYAPGAELTIDKYRFASAALYSPYAPQVGPLLDRARSYTACKTCGFMSLHAEAAALTSCPCCGSGDILRQRFIVPEGFAPDINCAREADRGDISEKAGRATRAQIEVQEPPSHWDADLYAGRLAVVARSQELVSVNKGIGDRGFMICPECGRTEPTFGPGFTRPNLFRAGKPTSHKHPLEQGRNCDGTAAGPYYLGHSFPTDVLLFRLRTESPTVCLTSDTAGLSGRPGRIALTSLAEALCLAASRELQIDEGELAGNWCPTPDGDRREVYLFLHDLLPGGAGYTRLVQENLSSVLDATEKLLDDCNCESSCYCCLRHFGNNPLHTSLDRHLALALLKHLRRGQTPGISADQARQAFRPLEQYLHLRGMPVQVAAQRGELIVPLLINRANGSEIWIEIHHPLADPAEMPSALRDLATAEMAEYMSLDTFTLLRDLPAAVSALELE